MLQALPYDRGSMGMMGSSSTTIPLLTLSYTSAATTAVALPGTLNSIVDLGVPTKARKLVFSSGMGMGGMGMGGMMSFLIDGKSFDPSRVDLTSRVNEVEQWTIENRSSMDHPFHLHGTQFQVVESHARRRSDRRAVSCVARHRQRPGIRDGGLQGGPAPTGKRMYHCHILEHEDQGMMGVLEAVA